MPDMKIEKLYAPMLVVFLTGAAFGAMADRLYFARPAPAPAAATLAPASSSAVTSVILSVDGRDVRVRLPATPDLAAPTAVLRVSADAAVTSVDGSPVPFESLRKDDLISFETTRPPRDGDVIDVRALTLVARPPSSPPGR